MFKIELVCEKKSKGYIIEEKCKKIYDYELDDESSIVFDICNIFNENNIKFLVSGFGEDEWYVSCKFDLPEIIESLPEILRKIKRDNYNFKLDFYEQGLEREIIFKDLGDMVQVKCSCRIKWKPNPEVIFMSKFEIKEQFLKLYKKFDLLTNNLCPELLQEPLFIEWMKKFDGIDKSEV